MANDKKRLTARSKVAKAFIAWCESKKTLRPGYKAQLSEKHFTAGGMYFQFNGETIDIEGVKAFMLESKTVEGLIVEEDDELKIQTLRFTVIGDRSFRRGVIRLSASANYASLWLFKA